MPDTNSRLLVHSIFPSISGEVGKVRQGTPVVFLRMQGCNLRCPWCDTKESQEIVSDGFAPTVEKIEKIILDYPYRDVIITGGEPLLQSASLQILIDRLLIAGRRVSVETNGTFAPLLHGVYYIYDYKLEFPDRMISMREYAKLDGCDWVKIVVASREEFFEALRIFALIEQECASLRKLARDTPRFAISAGNLSSNGMRLKDKALTKWLLESMRDNIILNTQLQIGRASCRERV